MHSTPQSPSGSSSISYNKRHLAGSSSVAAPNSLSSGDGENNSIYTRNLGGNTFVAPNSLSSGEGEERVRLISSLSNTPTKSILKKPKQSLQLPTNTEDQSSSSSKERLSESSNVSFSDRDTPPEGVTKEGDAGMTKKPDFSPSNTYLETSFEEVAIGPPEAALTKVPPPTLPKPHKEADAADNNSNTLDRKIRNITQV